MRKALILLAAVASTAFTSISFADDSMNRDWRTDYVRTQFVYSGGHDPGRSYSWIRVQPRPLSEGPYALTGARTSSRAYNVMSFGGSRTIAIR